jgi:hypothetical protein
MSAPSLEGHLREEMNALEKKLGVQIKSMQMAILTEMKKSGPSLSRQASNGSGLCKPSEAEFLQRLVRSNHKLKYSGFEAWYSKAHDSQVGNLYAFL